MEIFEYSFFQNALAALLLVGIASAVVGTYVVARRMMFVAGGVTHASFGGLGLGYFLGVNPVVTAGLFAVASALNGCQHDNACAKTPPYPWSGLWEWLSVFCSCS